MTGSEFIDWLHSKKTIDRCEIDFTLDPVNPGAVVLLNIEISADDEKLIIPYPRLDDSEDTKFVRAVSVMLVLNRMMEQHGIEKVFGYIASADDGGIFEAKQAASKEIYNMQKGGK